MHVKAHAQFMCIYTYQTHLKDQKLLGSTLPEHDEVYQNHKSLNYSRARGIYTRLGEENSPVINDGAEKLH